MEILSDIGGRAYGAMYVLVMKNVIFQIVKHIVNLNQIIV